MIEQIKRLQDVLFVVVVVVFGLVAYLVLRDWHRAEVKVKKVEKVERVKEEPRYQVVALSSRWEEFQTAVVYFDPRYRIGNDEDNDQALRELRERFPSLYRGDLVEIPEKEVKDLVGYCGFILRRLEGDLDNRVRDLDTSLRDHQSSRFGSVRKKEVAEESTRRVVVSRKILQDFIPICKGLQKKFSEGDIQTDFGRNDLVRVELKLVCSGLIVVRMKEMRYEVDHPWMRNTTLSSEEVRVRLEERCSMREVATSQTLPRQYWGCFEVMGIRFR